MVFGRCGHFAIASHAERLGFEPQDDSEAWADEIMQGKKPGADPRSEKFQGGTFVLAEDSGDPTRQGAGAGSGEEEEKEMSVLSECPAC